MLTKITDWLDSKSISYKQLHHPPTKTSQQAADVRGQSLSIGGKALVLKVNDIFCLFVISAAKKLNSSLIKKHLKVKNLRFATPQELMDLTGLVPGSVPPFGKPILDLDIFVDNSIVKNDKIAFNAGSLTDSIIMSTKDYLQIAKPKIFDFSQS